MTNSKNNARFITTAKPASTEEKRTDKVTFILLAENYGYRMKSYGPLSLLTIGGKTLLEHQVNAIQSVFINFEIILCSGFESSKVFNFINSAFPNSLPIRIVENQVYYHSNDCEGLRLCMNNTRSNRIVICGGGTLLTTDYLKSLNIKKPSILYQEEDKNSNFEVGIIDNCGKLENFTLAIDNKKWTDIMFLTGDALIRSFYGVISKPEFKTKFLFEAVNEWRGKRSLNICKNNGPKIIKVDNIKTLKRMTE